MLLNLPFKLTSAIFTENLYFEVWSSPAGFSLVS